MNNPFVFILFLLLFPLTAPAAESGSTCYGTTSQGRLEGGVSLPGSGENFESYSSLGNLLGRTYVHDKVKGVVVESYKKLEGSHPDKVFMYGETGWEKGGQFAPHKTHQNGLSVDFMVPVLDGEGRSVPLPTGPLNRYGYDLEFDDAGTSGELRIDFEALGAHLVALHQAAREADIDLWRVIFDLQLQKRLFATEHGAYLQAHVEFSKKPAWVRHDEHYHVDFKVKCRPL